MDPMTMMAIANFGMQLLGSLNKGSQSSDSGNQQPSGGNQQPSGGGQPQGQKPYMPVPIPGMIQDPSTMAYNQAINQNFNKMPPGYPGQVMPGQGQSF